jgi:hypothetical protein
MATYTDKFCPGCKALAFKCKCGANPPPRPPTRTRPFIQATPKAHAPKVAAPEVTVTPSPATVELSKVTLDQIPGEPPKDNKGGRLNVYQKARREVYSYFVSKLTGTSQPAQ